MIGLLLVILVTPSFFPLALMVGGLIQSRQDLMLSQELFDRLMALGYSELDIRKALEESLVHVNWDENHYNCKIGWNSDIEAVQSFKKFLNTSDQSAVGDEAIVGAINIYRSHKKDLYSV